MVLNSAEETRLSAQIDEKNLPFLREGQEAVASSDAFPDRQFKARLYYVSPGVDVTRGSVEARFRVPDPPEYLRADMTISIDMGVAHKDRALTVPAPAVRESGGARTVQIVRGGRAETVKVETGVRTGSRVEIVSGAAAGDTVVLTPGIPDGARVRTRDTKG
jgi:HlyD family secretion protein